VFDGQIGNDGRLRSGDSAVPLALSLAIEHIDKFVVKLGLEKGPLWHIIGNGDYPVFCSS
jgi:hypothetical protein